MKKILFVSAVIFVAVATLAVAGFAYAQSQNPPNPDVPYGPGWMQNQGEAQGYGPGMMRGRGGWGMRGGYAAQDGEGPMHEYMTAALAEEFGVSVETIEALHDEGKTLWEYAEENGISAEEFQTKMTAARTAAFEAAAADGVISQEQADWMLSRMQQRWADGYGPGSAGCTGTGPRGGGGMGRGGRFQAQP